MARPFLIDYTLKFPDGRRQLFSMSLDAETLALEAPPPDPPPPVWTNLAFHQCSNCPLSTSEVDQCPLAVNLIDVVELCRTLPSYEALEVEVQVPERNIRSQTTAQRGLASLMGLIIATSGCPHTVFFRPMARFHLPFASEEETIFRATSTFLLAQYFVRREGGRADMDLEDLGDIYRNMQIVNRAITRRLWVAVELDSSINALVLLDLFSKALPDSIEDQLEEIRYLFAAWLDQQLAAEAEAS